jgi:5-hydroxyisourate hydrolase
MVRGMPFAMFRPAPLPDAAKRGKDRSCMESRRLMAGRLTTHVLFTGTGKPAAGLKVPLRRLPNGTNLTERRTNTDGRVDVPLLEGNAFLAGSYELLFEVGDYFRAAGVALPNPPFLNVIPIRFGLADTEHYRVPHLVSP